MIYRIIDNLEKNLIENIPKEVIDCWNEGLCVVAVAQKSDNELTGVVAFLKPYVDGGNIVLCYVNVVEEYRRQGIATVLVQKTMDILAVKGFSTVRAVVPYNNPDTTVVKFLKSIYFDSRKEAVNYISFSLGRIEESELYNKVKCQKALMSKVKSYNEVTTEQIEEFKSKLMQQQGISIKEEFDKDLVCFYTQDNNIIALSDYSQTSVFEISRSNIYTLKEIDAQLAFPAMFVYFIARALEVKSKDTIIRMFIYAKNEYRGLSTTVGDIITVEPVAVLERDM